MRSITHTTRWLAIAGIAVTSFACRNTAEGAREDAAEARQEAREAAAEARQDVREATAEAREEVAEAQRENVLAASAPKQRRTFGPGSLGSRPDE